MTKLLKLSRLFFLVGYVLIFSSCSVSKRINKEAQKFLFADTAIRQGHIGISVYDPAEKKYLYNHNADKYFIPASNTKLFSWYAGMKYLGDSLAGMRVFADKGHIYLFPTGDPTFLNPSFDYQPVYSFLKNSKPNHITVVDTVWRDKALGSGWAWSDFNEEYMRERSSMPVFGNMVELSGTVSDLHFSPVFTPHTTRSKGIGELSSASREWGGNVFDLKFDGKSKKKISIPFATLDGETNKQILSNALGQPIIPRNDFVPVSAGDTEVRVFYSQPTDSLFKPMMHRSDNFFAEQTLLMVSNEKLGYMSDEAIIDSILKSDLKDIPQKPRWVDGSGLSRYNLCTPQSFVWLLNKTRDEFSWERITNILPTGGEGTLSSYYKDEAGFIYAKTGTLSNNCALSGYLITKKNRLLIFSVLVNNYPTSATPVRRAVERFIKSLREKY
jgi:D-alanyl-D-alanine carboxypeptidase/D-alanyl-D-alanine-endopeptidase (penicillin-binding protein 4)